jgi:diaminopimelate decarboxylase
MKKGEERSKAFPKRIKAFLLYTIFGFLVHEVCQLENIKHYTQVWQMIRTVGDQLKANEISLLGETHEDKGGR